VKQPTVNPTTCYEDELLICCARVSQSPDVKERVEQLLREPIDWQIVLDRSWWHRIRPLTFHHLSAQPAGLVPAAFLEALGTHARELEQRNRYLFAEQHRVAQMFEDASLPMLFFKGPLLALNAYGDLMLRECGDLDMLIRPTDFPRVKDMLTSHGFACLWDQVESERKRQLFACEFRRESVELERNYLLSNRVHDEHWFAEHFRLSWPCRVLDGSGARFEKTCVER